MSVLLAAVIGLAAGALAVAMLERLRRTHALARSSTARRIAFPFTGVGLSKPAMTAALRIARAERATLVPVYLAIVPLELPFDVPLTGQCEAALPLLEAVEQRAARAEVAVDSRIERGRSVRHALAQLIAHEQFERIVVAASSHGRRGEGFSPEDIAWLLDSAPGEVVALRAAPGTAPARRGARDEDPTRIPTAPVPTAGGRDRVTARGRSIASGVAHDVAGG